MKTPKAPPPPTPVKMPEPTPIQDTTTTDQYKKKMVTAARSRSGRASTFLTDTAQSDSLGG